MSEIKIVLDAGTTWSKIIEKSSSSLIQPFEDYYVRGENNWKY